MLDPKVMCSLLWTSLWPNVYQERQPLTLVLVACGFLPPFLWLPFLNMLQPGGGYSAQPCLTCFLDLRNTFI